MKKLLVFLFLFIFFFPHKTLADEGWTITSYTDNIAIQPDGRVHVTEHIDVDFQGLSKHGIYRDIPVVYEDTNGVKTYTEIVVTSVSQDNTPAKFSLETNDNNERIKIGDPTRTISGTHTYVIDYVASGVLRSFSDHDELYWNVTGNSWDVPINKTAATVTIPSGSILKTTCYQGYTGSTSPCTTSFSGTTAIFAADNLAANQGLTIVIAYPKGLVPILTAKAPPTLLQRLVTIQNFLLLFIPIILGILYMLSTWLKSGRDLWFKDNIPDDSQSTGNVIPPGQHETTIVEFTPPEMLRPAEIGVLMDQKADTLDITATIIDLATKEYLTIKEISKKWLFGTSDYELTQTDKKTDGLYPYEEKLLSSLFSSGKTVTVSSLKTTFYDDLAQIKKELYAHMTKKNYFVDNPETVRMKYVSKGIIIAVLGGVLFYIGIQTSYLSLFVGSASLIITGLIIIVIGNGMPRRTAYGHELYRRSLGYKEFLERSEKYREQFFEKRNMLNDMLPYTIVFGVTEKFAKAMADMGIKPPQPTWYTGSHPFYISSFGQDVNGFSKSLSTAMAQTPSKTGGFSSGGSGGGFGGGGGGSW